MFTAAPVVRFPSLQSCGSKQQERWKRLQGDMGGAKQI